MPLPSQSVSTRVLISTGFKAVFTPNEQMSFQVTNYLFAETTENSVCSTVLVYWRLPETNFAKMYVFPLCLSRRTWIGVEHSFISKSLIWICFCGYELCYHSGSGIMASGLASWQFLSHLLWEAPLEVLVRHHLSTCLASGYGLLRLQGDVLFIPSPGGALPGWNFSELSMLLKCTPGDRWV